MKKEINIDKLSEIFLLNLDITVGSEYYYYSEYIRELSHNKQYFKEILEDKKYNKTTVEEIIEDFVKTSNKIIVELYDINNKLTKESEELKEYKDFINKKCLNNKFNTYIKEKEEECNGYIIPF